MRLISIVLMAAALAETAFSLQASAQSTTDFHGVGYIGVVDPFHEVVTLNCTGQSYVLDTKQCTVRLIVPTKSPPTIDDLVVGMRVSVIGVINAPDRIAASVIQVMPYVPPGKADFPQHPPPFPAVIEPPAVSEKSIKFDGVSIRGTVSAEATVFVRKIRVMTSVGEVSVSVPRGIPIMLAGEPISVHDLRAGTDIIVMGKFTGLSSMTASRILIGDGGGLR